MSISYRRHPPSDKEVFALESSKILYSLSFLSVTIFIFDFDLMPVFYQYNSAESSEVALELYQYMRVQNQAHLLIIGHALCT